MLVPLGAEACVLMRETNLKHTTYLYQYFQVHKTFCLRPINKIIKQKSTKKKKKKERGELLVQGCKSDQSRAPLVYLTFPTALALLLVAPEGAMEDNLRTIAKSSFLLPHFLEPMDYACVIHLKTFEGGQRIAEKK